MSIEQKVHLSKLRGISLRGTLDEHLEISYSHNAIKEKEYENLLSSFNSPYFIAVHWRLWYIATCSIATLIAVFGSGSNVNSLSFSVFITYKPV